MKTLWMAAVTCAYSTSAAPRCCREMPPATPCAAHPSRSFHTSSEEAGRAVEQLRQPALAQALDKLASVKGAADELLGPAAARAPVDARAVEGAHGVFLAFSMSISSLLQYQY